MQTGNLVYLTNFNVPSLQTGSQQGQKKQQLVSEVWIYKPREWESMSEESGSADHSLLALLATFR